MHNANTRSNKRMLAVFLKEIKINNQTKFTCVWYVTKNNFKKQKKLNKWQESQEWVVQDQRILQNRNPEFLICTHLIEKAQHFKKIWNYPYKKMIHTCSCKNLSINQHSRIHQLKNINLHFKELGVLDMMMMKKDF